MSYGSSGIGHSKGKVGILIASLVLFTILWPPESLSDALSGDRAIVRTAPERGGGPKVALVIGNKDYQRAPLQNPVNDVEAVRQVLTPLGFSVTTKTNANQQELEEAIERFCVRIQDAQAALLYFSGHGCQVGGENYLVPVGYNFLSDADLRYKAVNVGHVLAKMEQARSKVNIIVLDACRDNPFKGVRAASGGLAALEAPSGTFIAYATSPGKVASDTPNEKNSVYTKHLVKALETKGLTIEQAFKMVSKGVNSDTNGRQVPWTSSSLVNDFCFSQEPVVHGSPTIPATPPPPVRSSDEADDLRKLADAGNAKAQFELGLKFEFGLGVPRDLERAKNLYYMAARQGERPAQEALARLIPPPPVSPPTPSLEPSVGSPTRSPQSEEMKALVEKGVGMVKAKGLDATLKAIGDPKGPFVKGDLYLFAGSLDRLTLLAHPIAGAQKYVGPDHNKINDPLVSTATIKCKDVAERLGSGWVEYMWLKPGAKEASPKTSFVMRVPGKSVYIGASHRLK